MFKPVAQHWLLLLTLFCSSVYSLAQDDDPYLGVAKYQFYKGEYSQALTTLNQAESLWPVNDVTSRQLLAAEVLIEQGRFDSAAKIFSDLPLSSVQSSVQASQQGAAKTSNPNDLTLLEQTAFPLAKLAFAQADCAAVIEQLNGSNKLSALQQLEGLYFKSVCVAGSELLSLADLETLETQMNQLLSSADVNQAVKQHGHWLAYSNFNLAVAANRLQLDAKADQFFAESIRYIDASSESAAFRNKVLMTRAFSKYNANLYDESLNLFAELDINGLWADQALLGYGWSAYYTYNQGMAIEAWRQLIHLPYKTISVYEGMIAIPFVLEKSNSFARALDAYDFAVQNYSQALEEISQLEANISLEGIRKHAEDYLRNQQVNKSIEPLHPTLAGVYAKGAFRQAVTEIGDSLAVLQQVQQMQTRLELLNDVSAWRPVAANSNVLNAPKQALMSRLDQQLESLDMLSQTAFSERIMMEKLPDSTQGYVQQWQALASAAGSDSQLSARLERLRKVLLFKAVEQGAYDLTTLNDFDQLIQEQHRLRSRVSNLNQTSNQLSRSYKQADAAISMLKQRVASLQADAERAALIAQQRLLDLTLAELKGYKQTIAEFQKHARISRARLKEEFYQLGGQKL